MSEASEAMGDGTTGEPRRSSSRDTLLRTARRMFAARGYSDVSIRDIAAAAGVSPALVIKHFGTKEAMFSEAVRFEPSEVVAVAPLEEMGETLVRRVLEAQRAGRPAPLTRAVVLVLPSPDPEDMRRRFAQAYLEPLTQRLGGDAVARRKAQSALAAATGLSVALRVFHFFDDPAQDEELVRTYGAAVQSIIDA